MSRALTAAVIAELAKAGVRPAIFVEAEFTSGVVNLWSGLGEIVWNSKTWQGVGTLGGISPVKESADVRADNFILSLSGIPADLLGKALGEVRYGKKATVWVGFMNEAGTVIVDPFVWTAGITDRAEIEEAGETATIRINCENELAALHRVRERRYTPEDQKSEFPGDLGFDYVAKLQEKNVFWGGGAAVPTAPAPRRRPPSDPRPGPL